MLETLECGAVHHRGAISMHVGRATSDGRLAVDACYGAASLPTRSLQRLDWFMQHGSMALDRISAMSASGSCSTMAPISP